MESKHGSYELIVNKEVQKFNEFIMVKGKFNFFVEIQILGKIGTNLSTIKVQAFTDQSKNTVLNTKVICEQIHHDRNNINCHIGELIALSILTEDIGKTILLEIGSTESKKASILYGPIEQYEEQEKLYQQMKSQNLFKFTIYKLNTKNKTPLQIILDTFSLKINDKEFLYEQIELLNIRQKVKFFEMKLGGDVYAFKTDQEILRQSFIQFINEKKNPKEKRLTAQRRLYNTEYKKRNTEQEEYKGLDDSKLVTLLKNENLKLKEFIIRKEKDYKIFLNQKQNQIVDLKGTYMKVKKRLQQFSKLTKLEMNKLGRKNQKLLDKVNKLSKLHQYRELDRDERVQGISHRIQKIISQRIMTFDFESNFQAKLDLITEKVQSFRSVFSEWQKLTFNNSDNLQSKIHQLQNQKDDNLLIEKQKFFKLKEIVKNYKQKLLNLDSEKMSLKKLVESENQQIKDLKEKQKKLMDSLEIAFKNDQLKDKNNKELANQLYDVQSQLQSTKEELKTSKIFQEKCLTLEKIRIDEDSKHNENIQQLKEQINQLEKQQSQLNEKKREFEEQIQNQCKFRDMLEIQLKEEMNVEEELRNEIKKKDLVIENMQEELNGLKQTYSETTSQAEQVQFTLKDQIVNEQKNIFELKKKTHQILIKIKQIFTTFKELRDCELDSIVQNLQVLIRNKIQIHSDNMKKIKQENTILIKNRENIRKIHQQKLIQKIQKIHGVQMKVQEIEKFDFHIQKQIFQIKALQKQLFSIQSHIGQLKFHFLNQNQIFEGQEINTKNPLQELFQKFKDIYSQEFHLNQQEIRNLHKEIESKEYIIQMNQQEILRLKDGNHHQAQILEDKGKQIIHLKNEALLKERKNKKILNKLSQFIHNKVDQLKKVISFVGKEFDDYQKRYQDTNRTVINLIKTINSKQELNQFQFPETVNSSFFRGTDSMTNSMMKKNFNIQNSVSFSMKKHQNFQSVIIKGDIYGNDFNIHKQGGEIKILKNQIQMLMYKKSMLEIRQQHQTLQLKRQIEIIQKLKNHLEQLESEKKIAQKKHHKRSQQIERISSKLEEFLIKACDIQETCDLDYQTISTKLINEKNKLNQLSFFQ